MITLALNIMPFIINPNIKDICSSAYIVLTLITLYHGISLNYKSPQQYENFLSSDHPIIDNIVRFPIETIPEISLVDLKVSKRISNIEMSLNINNIFNKDYVLIQHYPMPGKTWQINLSKIIK